MTRARKKAARRPKRAKLGGKPAARRRPRRSPKRPPKRARESAAALRTRADRVYTALAGAYPQARCALDHQNAYELVVATILSAQCTDKRVNMVTPVLFARYPDARSLAAAVPGELEAIIQTTGFFGNKAKSLIGMARALIDRHGGEVPAKMEELVKLPGVGRKTANVVLGNAFGVNEGIVVDTHVARLSQRLRFAKSSDPVKIEQELMPLFPRARWTMLAHLLIWHGRTICDARKPKCGDCPVVKLCPSALV